MTSECLLHQWVLLNSGMVRLKDDPAAKVAALAIAPPAASPAFALAPLPPAEAQARAPAVSARAPQPTAATELGVVPASSGCLGCIPGRKKAHTCARAARMLGGAAAAAEAAVLPGRHVMIHSLSSRADLNGQIALCQAFDSATGRYNVSLPNGKLHALWPANLSEARDADAPLTNQPAPLTKQHEERIASLRRQPAPLTNQPAPLTKQHEERIASLRRQLACASQATAEATSTLGRAELEAREAAANEGEAQATYARAQQRAAQERELVRSQANAREAAVVPPAKPVSSRRSGSVTKQGWSREEDEKIMDAYQEKGARPAPLPRFHARALPKCTCALNMHPNARARSMR